MNNYKQMKKLTLILQLLLWMCMAQPAWSQIELKELSHFREPVGNWNKAGKVEMDSLKPEILTFEPGKDCFINGANGKAKYLVSKKEYQDIEFHIEFMIPKGSNAGVSFQSRYEVQILDSWGETNITYYDCGGIFQGLDNEKKPGEEGFDGHAPMHNASKPPGEWQRFDIIFRAPVFDEKGEKVKNAMFEKVLLNGVVVQENVELTGPIKGSKYRDEVSKAPFRLQGGHGPVAYRNIRIRELEHTTKSKPNKWVNLFENTKSGKNYDFIVHGDATEEEANAMFEYNGKELKAMYKWQEKAAPYGIAVTKKVYGSYDLKFEFKWGERRFEPRLTKVRDAGLLYHCQAGSYAWPPSLEYQIQEGDSGDLWCILGCLCDVVKDGVISSVPAKDYSRSIKWSNAEKPGWNKVRLEVRGDKAKYYLNGVLVNEIKNASFGGQSCKSGFIAFQAEYSEIRYRKIKIKEL